MSHSKAGLWPEGLTLPAVVGGHPSPRKSKNVNGLSSSNPDPITWEKRQKLKKAIKAASRLRGLRKRGIFKRPASQPLFPGCRKRYFQFVGHHAQKYANYVSRMFGISREPVKVYELWTLGSPFCSFTSLDEALFSCASIKEFGGIQAEVREVDLSQSY